MEGLHHIGLFVKELEQAKKFWCTYFGGTANEMYHNPRTGLKTYMLSFALGACLELMNRPETAHGALLDTFQCGYAHIAFNAGSKDKVDSLTSRLSDDGYKVVSAPRTTGDGYYESCVADPEGNLIEIIACPEA